MRGTRTSKFTGLTEAIDKLNNLQQETPQIIEDEFKTLGRAIMNRARSLAPEETGALKKGIRYINTKTHLTVYVHAYNKRTGYDYSIIQHNNPNYHHSIGEYQFLKKAVDIETQNYKRRIARRVKNLV